MNHENQRVAVFVDVQNMYYSAKQLYNSKVNFNKILNDAVGGRKLIRAMAYAISADVQGENKFQDALAKIGYEVRLKDLQIFYGGAKKGDWDVGIAMDVVRIAPKVDVIVLISGDGDFQDLLEYVKAQGCRAEVMAFGKTASSRIKEASDQFVDMGKEYLIYDKNYELRQIQKELNKNNDQAKSSENKEIDKSSENKVEANSSVNTESKVKKKSYKKTKKVVKKEETVVNNPTPNNLTKKPGLLDKIKKVVKKKE
ncbi:NYN domain-containing protein [Candidatus Woesearchaeota archaeon]|nr:NYN domain-containing protein [Candidatus Woesearchaeota archaeon]